jgi:hypothetical protein
MNKFVIAANPGGISNRIKCLVSVWRIGEKFEREPILYWPKNSACGCHFKDLFENNVKEISREDLVKILKKREFQLQKDDDNLITENNKEFFISKTWRFVVFKNEMSNKLIKDISSGKEQNILSARKGQSIDYEYDRVPLNLREEILIYLKKLKPLKKLQKKIDEFNYKNKIWDCVGVHIRRGDFVSQKKDWKGRFSGDEKFIKKMREILKKTPKQRFFLCTDSLETENKFKELFGKRIINFKKTNFDRANVLAVQEGLIDLMLLSKTKHILGTYGSTYTETAWWFGGCKAKMEEMMTHEEKKQISKMIKKFKRNPINFLKRITYNIINLLHIRRLDKI